MYEFSNLSTEQLLKLTVNETAANEILNNFPSAKDLSLATPEELQTIKGLGPIKAKQLLAALALGKKAYATPKEEQAIIRSPKDVFDLLGAEMQLLDREHFKVINLNTKNKILYIDTTSIGSLSSSIVHPREVFKLPIKKSAATIILVHNHPSGDSTPSKEDLEVSKRLFEVGKIIGIEVLDHIIIGDTYCSLKERGLL